MKLLISQEQIAQKVADLAQTINQKYKGKELIIVAVLKGSVCFVADLIRHLDVTFQLFFISAQSYGMRGTKRGELTLTGLEDIPIQGKHILLLDDIYDSGHTLSEIVSAMQNQKPSSIYISVLLKKNIPHVRKLIPDLVCFDIEDYFVVGYGLDYQEHFRGLKEIYALLL